MQIWARVSFRRCKPADRNSGNRADGISCRPQIQSQQVGRLAIWLKYFGEHGCLNSGQGWRAVLRVVVCGSGRRLPLSNLACPLSYNHLRRT